MKTIYWVIPCYNEEAVLPETAARLVQKITSLQQKSLVSPDSRVVFVDDGSRDKTWEIIDGLHRDNPLFCGIRLSRNQGHQNALLAGLMTVKDRCDAVISMDADLQDDIEALDDFITAYEAGNDVVYGVRSSRKKDSAFKRTTARSFYRVMRFLGVDMVFDHADYRLMSRRALDALSQFREVNLFLRGVVPLVGFPCTTVTYERQERFAGSSKYPLRKMMAFAVDGITSFSVKPIRMVLATGFLIFLCSILVLIYSLVRFLCGHTVTGWTTTVASIWALGGIQLLSLGIVGEYVGKIYKEVKARPKFIVKDTLF